MTLSELERLPSNSHSAKELSNEPPSKPKVVARGEKVEASEGIFMRMIKHFFAMSLKEMAGHLLTDVIEPSAKNVLSDMVTNAKDLLLFGSSTSVSTTKTTDYNALSKSGSGGTVAISKQDRVAHNFQNVKLPSRKAAIDVLMAMREQLSVYGEVTVGYFYDIVGVDSDFTDYTFGWRHLNGADVKQTSGGWMLQLPPVKRLGD